MTTTNYIWDEQNYLAESDATNTINTVYTNEPAQYGNLISSRISGATSYHHFDALGSTRQLTNSAATTTDIVHFDAWGSAVTRAGTTPAFLLWFGVAGYYTDAELPSIYVRARAYRPAIARWISRDPREFIDGANRYLYVANRASIGSDPSGLLKIVILKKGFKIKPCGGYTVPYRFSLSKANKCKKPDGSKDYALLVQRIQIFEAIDNTCKHCSGDFGGLKSDEIFWELIDEFRPDQTEAVHNPGGATDVSNDPDHPNACGVVGVNGSIRVFCASEIAAVVSGWKPGEQQEPPVASGPAPSTTTEPSFWTKKKPIDQGSRLIISGWDCCGCPTLPRYFFVSNPTEDNFAPPGFAPGPTPVPTPAPDIPPRPPGTCFVAGTLVQCEFGAIGIEDVKPAMRAWAFDTVSKQWQLERVMAAESAEVDALFVTTSTHTSDTTSTDTHPYWVVAGVGLNDRQVRLDIPLPHGTRADEGRWIAAGDLLEGDTLLARNGQTLRVRRLRFWRASGTVYNLHVEGTATFAVGDAGIVVHNKIWPF
jgi:RHS repeat-associated protein